MKKWFKTGFLLVLAVTLLLPSYAHATGDVNLDKEIDFNASEKGFKIQSYKQKQKEMKKQISTDTLVVKYNKKLAQSVHQRAGTTIVRSIPSLGYDVVKLKKGQDLKSVISYYAKSNNVVSVQPSMKYKPFGQGDPKKSSMYHLPLLNIDKALKLAGNHPVTVAVIDTGIDKSHPELKSQILPPFNAANPAAGQVLDLHGTHVAGIIGAKMNNGIGGHGVSPNAKILPIDVFNGDWGASDYVIAEGIMHAINKGADVINMSLGGYFDSSILEEAVKKAIDAGITVVAAAGNEATDDYSVPASYDGVISVGSVDQHKKLALDSNYGPSVNLVAPGVDVYSTIFDPLKGSSFMSASGTSMASPVVAGVVALIKSKYPHLKPYEVQALLEMTATDLGEKGYDHTFGHGLVNPVAALTYDLKKLPKKANLVPEEKILANAKVIPDTGKQVQKGSFTKPGEVDYYRLSIREGEKLQTILSGSDLYDYQFELTFLPTNEDNPERILVNDAKAGSTEGYLFEAEEDGTILFQIRDANGNYSLAGKSNYTLETEKFERLMMDNASIDHMIPIELPFQSTKDQRGPFTLLSEDSELADYDYFTFSVKEKRLVSIELSDLPGVDTSLSVYLKETFNKDLNTDPFSFDEENDAIAMSSMHGYGKGEKLAFEALPNVEYVLEVASEPQVDFFDLFDLLFGLSDEVEMKVGRANIPYELTVKTVVLPPDEDGLPLDDLPEDLYLNEAWTLEKYEEAKKDQRDSFNPFIDEAEDCEQINEDNNCDDVDEDCVDEDCYEELFEEDEERMFEEFEVDNILEHAVHFNIGKQQQGYFQFDGDVDFYQFSPNADAIYEIDVKEGENQSPFVTVFEYDEETHDFIPLLDLESLSFFGIKSDLKGAVALQQEKQYVIQIMNFEGISVHPYKLQVSRIKNVPVAKSDHKSKPELAQAIKVGEKHEDYFLYHPMQYYYYKHESKPQIFNVQAIPKKLPANEQSKLPTLLNNDLIVGMAIIEDTNGNMKLDEEEYGKLLEFYPNIHDASYTVNGSFQAKKDGGYFVLLASLSEGFSTQQYSIQMNNLNRKDEDRDSVVKNNIPSKPLSLKSQKGKFVGKGYFNAGIPYGDKDYYLLNVKKKGKATLTLKAGHGLDGVIKVYNEKGTLVGKFDYYGAGDDEIGTLSVTKGKYFVEVSEATDTPSVKPYELSIILK